MTRGGFLKQFIMSRTSIGLLSRYLLDNFNLKMGTLAQNGQNGHINGLNGHVNGVVNGTVKNYSKTNHKEFAYEEEVSQLSSRLLLIRPVAFGFNPETAADNPFQNKMKTGDPCPQQSAQSEFDRFVRTLTENGLDLTIIEDTVDPWTPDSIFPNWHSFHAEAGGTLVLYPMYSEMRRAERKPQFIETFKRLFEFKNVLDLTYLEHEDDYLESTGSLIFDRANKLAYANLSNRTSLRAIVECCRRLKYTPVVFQATYDNGKAVYHTDLIMSIGETYVLICLESIRCKREREEMVKIIKSTGKDIIPITMAQVDTFAGNQIQVVNRAGERLLLMSTTAYWALEEGQRAALLRHNKRIVTADIETIEKTGGGSIKCMITEIHVPNKITISKKI